MNSTQHRPLVYACSGASSAAQMANHIAVRLDRLGMGEMSCIAGVGGDVKPLVRTARSGRPILVLDGCPLQCAARILQRHGIRPNWHFDLSQHGVSKRQHEDYDPSEAARMLDEVAASLRGEAPPNGPKAERGIAVNEVNEGCDTAQVASAAP
ncbi:MAG: putative zinc-binding protein [Verrucomicrobiales bacterium]|nr:putative zinc-binding protein [Verrucomicrobiales bacterium]